MEFTLFTYGDLNIFAQALNAVAMLFNPREGTWTSGSALGLGAVAAVGLLLCLIILGFTGILRQEVRIETLLVLIIAYSAMFVPKARLNLEDLYTGQIAAVDNVPIGVALPAGIVSALTHKISGQIETAFSTVDGNYVAMTADGFVQPLKLLLALRQVNGCSNVLLCNSIIEWARYCSSDGQGNHVDVQGAQTGADIVGTVYATPIRATTPYYSPGSPLGALATCQQAGQYIQQSIHNFLTDTSDAGFGALYNAAVTQQLPQANGPAWSSRIANALQLVLANTAYRQEAVINTIVWGNVIAASFHAASISDRDLAYTAFMTDAMEKYKADAVGDANMFVKLMLPSMNILLFLFFAFAPIVAMVMMATGMHGLNVAAKFLLFGVWTQTWMPTSAIINFFIQMQFANTVNALNVGSDPANVISVSNQSSFYNLLSGHLAVASTYLAATPVLTLALLSGSFFAFTRLAERASGIGSFDGRKVSPDTDVAANVQGIRGYQQQTLGQAPHIGGSVSALTGVSVSSALDIGARWAQSKTSAAAQVATLRLATAQNAVDERSSAAVSSTSAAYETGDATDFNVHTQFGRSIETAVDKTWGGKEEQKFGRSARSQLQALLDYGASLAGELQGKGLPPEQATKIAKEQVEQLVPGIALHLGGKETHPGFLLNDFAKTVSTALGRLLDPRGQSMNDAQAAQSARRVSGTRGQNYSDTVRRAASVLAEKAKLESVEKRWAAQDEMQTGYTDNIAKLAARIQSAADSSGNGYGKILLDAVYAAEPVARAIGAEGSKAIAEFREVARGGGNPFQAMAQKAVEQFNSIDSEPARGAIGGALLRSLMQVQDVAGVPVAPQWMAERVGGAAALAAAPDQVQDMLDRKLESVARDVNAGMAGVPKLPRHSPKNPLP